MERVSFQMKIFSLPINPCSDLGHTLKIIISQNQCGAFDKCDHQDHSAWSSTISSFYHIISCPSIFLIQGKYSPCIVAKEILQLKPQQDNNKVTVIEAA